MEAALKLDASPRPRRRGDELLLLHCRLVGELDEERPPALARLEQELGAELTHLLLRALVPQRRRGSSSP